MIRIETWRVAYDGLVDPALLALFDLDHEAARRDEHWDAHHADPHATEFVAEVNGEPVGWAVAGPAHHSDEERTGELYAIYVLPTHWSTGVGHVLLEAAEEALRANGFDTAVLWVLDGNSRAATFYERHGWIEDGAVKLDERIEIGDTDVAGLNERRRVRDLRSDR